MFSEINIYAYYLIFLLFIKISNNYNSLIYFLCLLVLTYYNYNFTLLGFNIGFVFILSYSWVIFIFYTGLNYKKYTNLITVFISFVLIFTSCVLIIESKSLLLIVIGFEVMMLSSLFLLKFTSKTERAVESIIEMSFWSLIGSFFLLSGLLTYYVSINSILSQFMLFCGFYIKIPLWPFYSWLVKAHVEASTEFSIFLSGFLVKFGVLGLFNILWVFENYVFINISFMLSIIGIIDATFKLFAQVDLKRIVALTTVIETNWLVLCLVCGSYLSYTVGIWIICIHCFTTTIEFYLVECIYRRYRTRSILYIGGLSFKYPLLSKIYLISLCIVIGIPGTSIFIAKTLFLSSLVSYLVSIYIIVSVIFLLILPIFFIKIFVIVYGGSSNSVGVGADLSRVECLILCISIIFSIIFGIYPVILS